MNIFYINIVYRKLSIRKCRAGGKCSPQEIENQQQLPNQFSDKVDDRMSIKSHNISSRNSPENIVKSNMMPEINSNFKDVEVNVVTCPDLRNEPFDLASEGKCH